MTRATQRDMLIELLKLDPSEKPLLLARMRGVVLGARIFPGPTPTPAFVYARVRYEQTGRRQWIIAPGLARHW